MDSATCAIVFLSGVEPPRRGVLDAIVEHAERQRPGERFLDRRDVPERELAVVELAIDDLLADHLAHFLTHLRGRRVAERAGRRLN
jgi:hypothetical protein